MTTHQATVPPCPECKDGRARIATWPRPAPARGPFSNPLLIPLRCRKCGHEWEMEIERVPPMGLANREEEPLPWPYGPARRRM